MEKWLLAGFLICTLVLFIYIVVPHIAKLIIRKKSLVRFGQGPHVCLSFDDGPDISATDSILSILKEHDATAMFFITGQNALQHPECVDRIIQSGNIVGEHGFNHIHPWKSGPVKTIRDFIRSRKLFALLERKHQIAIRYYRPPYGKYNIISLILYLWYGKIPVFWHLDPKDYNAESPESIVGFISEHVGPGKVVLLHDGRYGENNRSEITVNAVKSLFENPGTARYNYSVAEYR